MKMKSFCSALVTTLVFSMAGCGGGGGGGTPSATATGKFIDAPIEGLKYVSGGHSGFTDPNGVFTYEVGQPVTFSVGGVIIGQAPGASVITPKELVNAATGGINADATTPAVIQIVRFLLTASSTTSAGGLKIDQAVIDACTASSIASQNINLSTANGSSFTTMINQVATAAGNRPITNTTDAINHLTASLGGGGSPTKAVVTVSIPPLPAGKQVAGVSFKIQLPAGVAPSLLSGADPTASLTLIGGAIGSLSGAAYDLNANTITSGNITTTPFGAGDFLVINCSIKSNTTVSPSNFKLLVGSAIDFNGSSLGVTPTISVALL